MLKDKITEIVETLIEVTKSGVLVWIEDNPISPSREYKRKMISTGEDGTVYEMEIKFSLRDDSWEIEDRVDLWVKNKNLPEGLFYITSSKSDGKTKFLRDFVLSNFCKDMNPKIEDVEEALSNIARGINISEFRERKLKKILK